MTDQVAIPMPRATVQAHLVMVLSRDHQGRTNGVSAQRLAARLQVPERLLRELISKAREEGTAIVGTPETGYFVAETAEELEQCCQFLRARAMHSLHIEARLRQIPLPDLLGQLRLNT
jgi:biotin operon repressor